MKGYRKILIAVDGSMDVLKEGLKLARDEKCWVTVLKAIPPYEGDLDLTGIKNIGDALDSGLRSAVREVEATVKEERALVKVRVEEGDIPERIRSVAQEENCDLIIMGGQKRKKGLFGFLSANIVGKVIASAPCPVLVLGGAHQA